jgi:hypothetical protein
MRLMQCTGVHGLALGCLLGMVLSAGCDSTPSQADLVRRDQDQALNDPMNYSPNMDDTDVSGGDTGNYNDKAMKRDVNDFVNP